MDVSIFVAVVFISLLLWRASNDMMRTYALKASEIRKEISEYEIDYESEKSIKEGLMILKYYEKGIKHPEKSFSNMMLATSIMSPTARAITVKVTILTILWGISFITMIVLGIRLMLI